MSRLLTNRRLFILLAALIVVTVFAGLTVRGRVATWPERALMDVENAVAGVFYRPAAQLTAFLQGIHDLRDMYRENAALKAQLQNYSALRAKLTDLEAENARLKQMLGYKQGAGARFRLIPAQVIGRDPGQWNSGMTIDAGRAAGVASDMAVVSADGSLVGRIAQVADNSAKVVLITDTRVGDGVSARVQAQGAEQPFGIVVGSASGAGRLDMTFLSPVAQVRAGDTVVTSGLSDIFPAGIVIGTVEQVHQGAQGLTQSALVQPAADLDYLQEVFVIARTGGAS
ncbi:rod shape-determining protein MreC [Alicyclobacillus sp.]|uniref:rod shape-determining protein MreC n=1 Tax=Alicyclobacillus sp. TaxID=61169 RepID=UPI0025BF1146|nr:rod shape-determining protein MreC [Alicyclobacillus sp.]MCL6516156.1 rod shape-determining protein MreC [Alicyclobacillus sp.]